MWAVLLGLLAAAFFGISDFVNGLITKRSSPWPIATLACAGATAVLTLAALVVPGQAANSDYAWATASGLGNGIGTYFLYRGLATGRMGVVAPVSAVGSAVIPVAIAVTLGERPDLLVWLAVLIALPGIWLVSREPEHLATDNAGGLTDGLLAGVGFGLMFLGLGKVPEGHGFWPVVWAEVIATVSLFVAARFAGWRGLPARLDWIGLGGGALAGIAIIAFTLTSRLSLLSIAAVLVSLYPAITVLLAALVLREVIHRAQFVGLAMCVLTVALVAIG